MKYSGPMMIEKIVIITLISLFIIIEFSNLNLPGLYSDETLPACGSLQMIKKVGPFITSLKISKINFPLMLAPYATALESYILLPFFLLFGINVFALRLAPVVVGAIALILLYLFVKNFFNKKTALISLVLLVTNPAFLLETKLGLNSASMLHFAEMATLLSFYKWYKTENGVFFLLGMFLLGIGISIRVWFVWFVLALLFCVLLLFRARIMEKITRRFKFYFAGSIISFLSGVFLFLVYNLINNFVMFRFIISKFRLTCTNVDNSHYIRNLLHRISVLSRSLSGRWSIEELGSWFCRSWLNPYPLKNIPVNHFIVVVFYLSFIWIGVAYLSQKTVFAKKRLAFIFLLFYFILLLSPFTLSSLGGPHLFILYPFAMIIIAIAIVDSLNRNKTIKIIGILVCAIVIIINIGVFWKWESYFYRTGGTGNNSDAIYSLVDWLEKENITEPIVCDWGIYDNIVFLSKGKIIPLSIYSLIKTFPYGTGEEDIAFIKNCNKLVTEKGNFYIFHTPKFTNVSRYDTFERIVQDMNKNLVREKIFYQRDGKPIFVVFSVR